MLLTVLVAVGLVGWWAWRAQDVTLIYPTLSAIIETITSSGRVRGVIETVVGAKGTGMVETLYVDEGDRVTAGQPLAMLKRDVAPIVRGQAFASKEGSPYGVSIIGADPEVQDQVTPVTKNLVAGHFHGLGGEEVVIDYELARDLNVSIGDRIRLTSSAGVVEAFTMAGIYN